MSDYPIDDSSVSLRYRLDGEWYETQGIAAIINVLASRSLLGSMMLPAVGTKLDTKKKVRKNAPSQSPQKPHKV